MNVKAAINKRLIEIIFMAILFWLWKFIMHFKIRLHEKSLNAG